MSVYQHKKLSWLRVTAWCLRAMAKLLHVWPLLLLCGLFLFPNNWHVRVYYEYTSFGQTTFMTSCTYLGTQGFRRFEQPGSCPVFVNMSHD